MPTDYSAAYNLTFLALTVWRESRGENAMAKLAVAYSILERVHHPSWMGKTVLEVVGKRWQYSSMTVPKDPNLVQWPTDGDLMWMSSLTMADAALKGSVANPAVGANSYFDVSIVPPSWAKDDDFVCQIGRLRFYNLNRDYEAEAMK